MFFKYIEQENDMNYIFLYVVIIFLFAHNYILQMMFENGKKLRRILLSAGVFKDFFKDQFSRIFLTASKSADGSGMEEIYSNARLILAAGVDSAEPAIASTAARWASSPTWV